MEHKIEVFNSNSIYHIVSTLTIAIVSFAFVFFYSTATSLLYPTCYGNDAAQFQTIGMAWAKGLVPYINAFDHKGPLIFFVNMLGYLSSYILVQGIFLFGSLLGIFYISKLYTCKWYYQWLTVLISVFYLFYIYEGGDMTEEYCLPFIAWSVYFIVKYFKSNNLTCTHEPLLENAGKEIAGEVLPHPWKYAVVYGLCFGACFLTRVTNVVMVAVGVAVIFISLLISKKFKNIGVNTLGFLLGLATLIVPFTIYFTVNGAYDEFLEGTIFTNISYVNANKAWITVDNTPENIRNWIMAYLSVGLMIVPIFVIRSNARMRAFCILALAIELYLYLGGHSYYHYSIVCLPQLALVIGEFLTYKGKNKWISFAVLSAVFLWFSRVNLVSFFRWPYDRYLEYNQEDVLEYDPLMDYVDGTFAAYGDFALKSVYLRYDIVPNCPYFSVQEWHAGISEEMSQRIHDAFATGETDYILVEESKCVLIRDVLEEQYELIDRCGGFGMYRKR